MNEASEAGIARALAVLAEFRCGAIQGTDEAMNMAHTDRERAAVGMVMSIVNLSMIELCRLFPPLEPRRDFAFRLLADYWRERVIPCSELKQ